MKDTIKETNVSLYELILRIINILDPRYNLHQNKETGPYFPEYDARIHLYKYNMTFNYMYVFFDIYINSIWEDNILHTIYNFISNYIILGSKNNVEYSTNLIKIHISSSGDKEYTSWHTRIKEFLDMDINEFELLLRML